MELNDSTSFHFLDSRNIIFFSDVQSLVCNSSPRQGTVRGAPNLASDEPSLKVLPSTTEIMENLSSVPSLPNTFRKAMDTCNQNLFPVLQVLENQIKSFLNISIRFQLQTQLLLKFFIAVYHTLKGS